MSAGVMEMSSTGRKSNRLGITLRSRSLHLPNNRIRKLISRRGAANVAGADLALFENLQHCGFDLVSSRALVEVTQHQDRGLQQRGRVRDSLARNVGG